MTRQHRGSTLVAVLVTVAVALMITTSLLFVSQAELAGRSVITNAAHSRALSSSGVQVIMQALDGQRDRILTGRIPELDDQYELYERDGRLGVVRLLPAGPLGEQVVPEAGRIDLNHITEPDMLADTGMLDLAQAADILEYRDRRRGGQLQSVGELVNVPGLTPAMVYGPLDEIRVMDDTRRRIEDLGERVAARLEASATAGTAGGQLRGLADLFTVYAVEPPLQRSGVQRINLNVEWSDDLGHRIENRFGEEAVEVLRTLMSDGTTFEDAGDVFAVLHELGVEPEDWPDIIDTFRTHDDAYAFGRLDINTAPYEALAALPTLEPEQASEVVRTRDEIPEDDLATIAWPAIHGIIDAEQYVDLAAHMTTRSWTFRLCVAAGTVPADDPDDVLINPVIYELVIDLADPSPRLAYVREITLMQATARLARTEAGDAVPFDRDFERFSPDDDEMADTGFVSGWGNDEPAQAWDPGARGDMEEFGEPATLDGADTLDDPPDDPEADQQGEPEESWPGRVGRWTPGG